jgi:hypothetical protein
MLDRRKVLPRMVGRLRKFQFQFRSSVSSLTGVDQVWERLGATNSEGGSLGRVVFWGG